MELYNRGAQYATLQRPLAGNLLYHKPTSHTDIQLERGNGQRREASVGAVHSSNQSRASGRIDTVGSTRRSSGPSTCVPNASTGQQTQNRRTPVLLYHQLSKRRNAPSAAHQIGISKVLQSRRRKSRSSKLVRARFPRRGDARIFITRSAVRSGESPRPLERRLLSALSSKACTDNGAIHPSEPRSPRKVRQHCHATRPLIAQVSLVS